MLTLQAPLHNLDIIETKRGPMRLAHFLTPKDILRFFIPSQITIPLEIGKDYKCELSATYDRQTRSWRLSIQSIIPC